MLYSSTYNDVDHLSGVASLFKVQHKHVFAGIFTFFVHHFAPTPSTPPFPFPLSPFPLSADVCCGKGRGLQLFPPWVLHHWFHIRSRRTSVSGQALVHVLSTSTNNDLCLCTVVGFSFLLHQENVYLKPHLCVVFLSYLFQHTVAFYYFVWDQTLNICNTG